MSVEIKNAIHAMGTLNVAAGTPSWTFQRGFTAAIVDNGPGDFTLHYERPVDPAECIVLTTVLLATAAVSTHNKVDDDHLRVYTWDMAEAPLDNVPMMIIVLRI